MTRINIDIDIRRLKKKSEDIVNYQLRYMYLLKILFSWIKKIISYLYNNFTYTHYSSRRLEYDNLL